MFVKRFPLFAVELRFFKQRRSPRDGGSCAFLGSHVLLIEL